jgi:hypothetical protein
MAAVVTASAEKRIRPRASCVTKPITDAARAAAKPELVPASETSRLTAHPTAPTPAATRVLGTPVYVETAQPAAMSAAATIWTNRPATLSVSGEMARTTPRRLATPSTMTMPTTMPRVSTMTWKIRAPAVT